MITSDEPPINRKAAEQALRHINHHGGVNQGWYVGIDDAGSNRDDSSHKHPMRYEMTSRDEAIHTMSWLLDAGLQADDEYGAEPTILFIYKRT
ncbi:MULTISPECIES: hypothetical protein [unclassified Pseudodesulfovibrio]|uniref:hypothetical protein n=1 Tax=unclassified Pseudodesulfovibrio TaxID=2661612 RepID=UPI000FEC1D8A|nr:MULTISPECIES: hypothetical protein [unclassified Pseudodesulfovibrio]MCJ2164793.1 hypothetical protein [Pseudodesulfovibrio sp. S3-i]RWU03835.1 hypothetical protein DWB63_10290 [Pseudodesulfovibrio sp. S3]